VGMLYCSRLHFGGESGSCSCHPKQMNGWQECSVRGCAVAWLLLRRDTLHVLLARELLQCTTTTILAGVEDCRNKIMAEARCRKNPEASVLVGFLFNANQ
jgi:hypothetical protein